MNYLLCAHRLVHGGQNTSRVLRSIDKAKIVAVLASRAIDSLRAAVLLADGQARASVLSRSLPLLVPLHRGLDGLASSIAGSPTSGLGGGQSTPLDRMEPPVATTLI
jgi:hypothetical protein